MTYYDFLDMLNGSKNFSMTGNILKIKDYYGIDEVNLDLSKLSEAEYERIRMKKRKAVDIEWDLDEEDNDIDLPTEFDIPYDVADEDVSDWLSDQTGFCNLGFRIEEMEDK